MIALLSEKTKATKEIWIQSVELLDKENLAAQDNNSNKHDDKNEASLKFTEMYLLLVKNTLTANEDRKGLDIIIMFVIDIVSDEDDNIKEN